MNTETVVITGASGGFGRELAKLFAADGYRAMMQGKAVVMPGLLYKLMALSPRLGPAPVSLAVNRMLLRRVDD